MGFKTHMPQAALYVWAKLPENMPGTAWLSATQFLKQQGSAQPRVLYLVSTGKGI